MDHRRHVELDEFLIEIEPPRVGERRVGPIAAARVRIEIAADEAEFFDATDELGDRVGRRAAGRLRQLTDRREVVGK